MKKIEMNGLIPVYILTSEDKDISLGDISIEENMAYIITGNQIMHYKRNREYTSLSPAKNSLSIPKLETRAIIHYPPIPFSILNAAIHFFREVYTSKDTKISKSESCVLLYLDKETGKKWKGIVPKQKVGPASVNYTAPTIEDKENFPDVENYFQAGSIHSHASMGACFSTTDDKDDLNFDGVHIVVGNFDTPIPNFAIRIMISGSEYSIPWEKTFIPDIEIPIPIDSFSDYIKLVEEKETTYYGKSALLDLRSKYDYPFAGSDIWETQERNRKKDKKDKKKKRYETTEFYTIDTSVDINLPDPMILLRVSEKITSMKIKPLFYEKNNSPVYHGEIISKGDIFDIWFNEAGSPIMVQEYNGNPEPTMLTDPDNLKLKEEVIETMKTTEGLLILTVKE